MGKFICLFVNEFICKERQNSKKKLEIWSLLPVTSSTNCEVRSSKTLQRNF